MARAKRSNEEYIREALQAAALATEPDFPSVPTRPVAASPMRYPSVPQGPSQALTDAPAAPSGSISEAAHNAAIQKLLAAAGGKVKVVSGKRSSQRQAQLWNNALKKYGSEKAARKWVAPPGRSRHESGLASDLGGDLNLAAKLAAQFGLYRPMAHEPWHFELIGGRRK